MQDADDAAVRLVALALFGARTLEIDVDQRVGFDAGLVAMCSWVRAAHPGFFESADHHSQKSSACRRYGLSVAQAREPDCFFV